MPETQETTYIAFSLKARKCENKLWAISGKWFYERLSYLNKKDNQIIMSASKSTTYERYKSLFLIYSVLAITSSYCLFIIDDEVNKLLPYYKKRFICRSIKYKFKTNMERELINNIIYRIFVIPILEEYIQVPYVQ